jgi:hypothetical protein
VPEFTILGLEIKYFQNDLFWGGNIAKVTCLLWEVLYRSGTRCHSWLRHCATSQEVDEVFEIFDP